MTVTQSALPTEVTQEEAQSPQQPPRGAQTSGARGTDGGPGGPTAAGGCNPRQERQDGTRRPRGHLSQRTRDAARGWAQRGPTRTGCSGLAGPPKLRVGRGYLQLGPLPAHPVSGRPPPLPAGSPSGRRQGPSVPPPTRPSSQRLRRAGLAEEPREGPRKARPTHPPPVRPAVRQSPRSRVRQ